MAKVSKGYVHYVAEIDKMDQDYPILYKTELVDTEVRLQEIRNEFMALPHDQKILAFDIETTGLNPEECKFVGYSFCWEQHKAYYIPIDHHESKNINEKTALDLVWGMLMDSKFACVYNARFEWRWMKHAGYPVDELMKMQHETLPDGKKISYPKSFDVAILVWHTDTNKHMPGLKWAARHFLGWEMQTYDETLNGMLDLSYVTAKEVAPYGGDDAHATRCLMNRLRKFFAESKETIILDNRQIFPQMAMEDHRINVNNSWLVKMRDTIAVSMTEIEADLHKTVGFEFKINSPKQLGQALEAIGLRTYKKTPTGAMSTKEDALKQIENEHEAVPKIMEYKKLLKMKSSYVETMIRDSGAENKIRFAYQTTNVPSGRLSAGADKNNSYFAGINTQSIPKPKPQFWKYERSDDPRFSILGYSFQPISNEEAEGESQVVEAHAWNNNIRTSFMPDPDHYWVSIDYSAQELRIPANLSKEPVMVDALANGEDLHKKVAISMFGEDGYNKAKRGIAKEMNFGLLYGGTAWTIANSTGEPVEECEVFVDKWWALHPVLKRWSRAMENIARKNGSICNAFGRPRRLKFWFDSNSYKDKGFACRSAVNHVVQGTAAEMMRIAMVDIFVYMKQQKLKEEMHIVSTIHDELNFSVSKHEAPGRILDLKTIMEMKKKLAIRLPDWKVPMETEVEVGLSWGYSFPFKVSPLGVWTPKDAA